MKVLYIVLLAVIVATAAGDKWQPVRDIINGRIKSKTTPSCVALVGDESGIIYSEAFGKYVYVGDAPPPNNNGTNPAVTLDTLYDMASLTKVTMCTTAVMQLYERGHIGLDDRVCASEYLGDDFCNNGKDKITIRNLLLHNAGLKPDPTPNFPDSTFPCPENGQRYPQEVYTCQPYFYKAIVTQNLSHPVGETYVYSDLSYMTLMYIVGIVARDQGYVTVDDVRKDCMGTLDPRSPLAGQCFYEAYIRKYVLQPLGMTASGYLPTNWNKVAPTENDRTYRHIVVQGQVHDQNTYAMGGISGHAGFFSNVLDVSKLMSKLMNAKEDDTFVRKSTVEKFTKVYNRTLSTRALGWDTNDYTSNNSNICGTLSKTTYMHTGYTGTAICSDPVRRLYTTLLCNPVYPNDNTHTDTTQLRIEFNSAVQRIVDSK